MKGPIILSTESSRYFAERIMKQLSDASIVDTIRDYFDDRERYLQMTIGSRFGFFGRDAIFVGSTVTSEDFRELCLVGSEAAKCGARRLIYGIPFFGNSTMDRAEKPGEIVTAKADARTLSELRHGDVRNWFLMLDLHPRGFRHYFEGDCCPFELRAEETLINAIHELGLTNIMFASADLGRPRRVAAFAEHFKTSLAFVRKTHDFKKVEMHEVIGDVAGKIVVIYDDMTRSGTSLIKAAHAYLAKGAVKVYAVLSHLALNTPGVVAILQESPIEKIIVTNSHPMSQHPAVLASPKFIVKDVSHLFADAIRKLLA